MLAHTRHIVLVTLPLGAVTGFLVALALRGLGSFEPIDGTGSFLMGTGTP